MKPTFIGLGGQKCASSWLYQIFSDHPEVFVSKPKEINFFSTYYGRGTQWYERYFEGAAGRTAVGEISPSYLSDSDAPARAYHYNPKLRIIVALRDPVDRAYSNHLHVIHQGYFVGNDLSFEAGLANNPMYVQQSRYAQHLTRWLEFFPMEQLFIVLQEDILADPQLQARHMYEFLNISAGHVSEFVDNRANLSYLPKSKRREKFVRSAGVLTRSIGLDWLYRLMRRKGVVSAIHRSNRLDLRQVVPPMRDETRAHLHSILAADTLCLAAIMGRKRLPWKTWEHAVSAQMATGDTNHAPAERKP